MHSCQIANHTFNKPRCRGKVQGKKKLYSVINAKGSHSPREKAFKKKIIINNKWAKICFFFFFGGWKEIH